MRGRLLERRVVGGEQRRDHLAVGGGAERRPLRAQLGGVDEVAVVPERDGARLAVVDERLRVRPLGAAGRRVPRVADRDLAAQAPEAPLVEDLADEAHLAHRGQPAALGDGDPRRLLAAVLEREEPEVRKPGDVALARADAEDAAHR